MPSLRSFFAFTALAAATLLLAAACETAPPVQEMSDARQAIQVAREAGAETHAAKELMEAEQYLHSAEEKLSAEEYAEARRAALQAKTAAQAARRLSEINRPNDPD